MIGPPYKPCRIGGLVVKPSNVTQRHRVAETVIFNPSAVTQGAKFPSSHVVVSLSEECSLLFALVDKVWAPPSRARQTRSSRQLPRYDLPVIPARMQQAIHPASCRCNPLSSDGTCWAVYLYAMRLRRQHLSLAQTVTEHAPCKSSS